MPDRFYDMLGAPPGDEDFARRMMELGDRSRDASESISPVIENTLDDLSTAKEATILELACGSPETEQPHWDKMRKVRNEQVVVFAVEKALIAVPKKNDTKVRYIIGNALDVAVIAQYPSQVDLVVLRHPNLTDESIEKWGAILLPAWNRLVSGGLLLVTHYHIGEYQQMLELLRQRDDSEIMNAGINPARDQKWERINPTHKCIVCPDQYLIKAKKR
jgi:hypothetical protein